MALKRFQTTFLRGGKPVSFPFPSNARSDRWLNSTQAFCFNPR
ncbi:hypothetical protein HMPREF9418_2397 [Neisseria macacae ATCC 33926]|uniref:Uncharacterized protein n=1 Tax=Neisseria macacae ATCC 33926 TaxID=997348 RepID=A0AA36UI68_9NEIS|nr:hypothetical protein HMPREF9418_2397 [Neisseria macacae ATCC 33926]